jgi:hypothetical protein
MNEFLEVKVGNLRELVIVCTGKFPHNSFRVVMEKDNINPHPALSLQRERVLSSL